MLQRIYTQLLKSFGPQGWWPLLNDKLVCLHSGRPPKTDNERFEIICGAILTQNTGWYPNVVRALQQLKIGRKLTKQEKEVVGQAEIIDRQYLEKQQKRTKRTILTQNTNWKNVEKALYNLTKNNLLDANKINKASKDKIARLIRPAGYYNQKAERLKIMAEFFLENKNPTREQLLALKGVGPETADSILLYAFSKPFFVIDAYTKRIFERLGYRAKDYDEWQRLFMNDLSKDVKLFSEYHALLVELGKNYCKKKPLCGWCPIKKSCKARIK